MSCTQSCGNRMWGSVPPQRSDQLTHLVQKMQMSNFTRAVCFRQRGVKWCTAQLLKEDSHRIICSCFFFSVYLRIVCFSLWPLDGSIATKIKGEKNKIKTLFHFLTRWKNDIQSILPHKKRLKLQDRLVYLWPLGSYCTFQSCNGPHEAVPQQVKEESVRNRSANWVMWSSKPILDRTSPSVLLN